MKLGFSVKTVVPVLLLALSFFGQTPEAPVRTAKTEMPPLEFGQTLEREIKGWQRHDYKLTLAARQYIRIEAQQNGCDIIFALYSKDGDNLFDVNNASTDGAETAAAAIEKGGEYNLQVVSMSDKSSGYSLKIAELRAASEKELSLTAGIVLMNRAFMKTTSSSTAESIREGIVDLENAREKFRLAGEKSFESRALNQIGACYSKFGDMRKSLEYLEKALEISYAIGDKYEISLNLNNLGALYQTRGDWQKAFEAFLKSLELRREIRNYRGEMITLNRLGAFFNASGDGARALEYFAQALEIIRRRNLSPNYEAETLENIGAAQLALSDPEKARQSFEKALEICRATRSRRREASVSNSLGKVYFLLGETARARQSLDEAIRISRDLGSQPLLAAALKNLGQVQLKLGAAEEALASSTQAFEIFRDAEDLQNSAEAMLVAARAELSRNDLETAQAKAEEAVSRLEKVRAQVQSAGLRDAFSANLRDFYGVYIEILMARHRRAPDGNFAALALQASERARARGLLNLLAESNVEIRQGVSERLLQKETELKNLLSARLENLTKVLTGKAKPEDVARLRAECERLRAEYEQTEAQIREASPRYAALTQPRTLSLAEIQAEVLDADSVLLEYALGEKKSYLWIVTKTELRTVELPAAHEIEQMARHFYDNLTARNRQIKFETPAERDDRILLADADAQTFSRALGEKILAPAAPFIKGKRLLVVADGVLQYVPFAALKIANPKSQISNSKTEDRSPKSEERFLIETNELVNLPSASTLAVLRKENAGRRPAPKTLAVLADPIFERQDERLQNAAQKRKPAEAVAVSTRRTREGLLELSRLPFTRREAETISSFVPAGQGAKFLDFDASRQSAMSGELSNYRYLHFATHGFIDSDHPELSGIVLSLFDESGTERDGVLRIGDIYNLRLPAELVVLSACKTGLGREIRGEGVVGLTRSFMYAGAKRAAVSLWSVNDEATTGLMAGVYREMLGKKKLAPASALREAQVSMLRQKNWQAPYFWASFVLQGEPR